MTARSIANRANAAHSTGPQSRRGKARASRNALRHGLTALCLADDGAEATRIADLISSPDNLLARDQAVIIAERCSRGSAGRARRRSRDWRSPNCPRSSNTSAARYRAGGERSALLRERTTRSNSTFCVYTH